jgi:hypothetical protein
VASSGQPLVQRRGLREDAGALPDRLGLPAGVHPEDFRGPRRRTDEVQQDVDGGRLPRPVGPQKAEDVALLDGQIEVLKRRDVAELLRHAVQLDRGHGRGYSAFG